MKGPPPWHPQPVWRADDDDFFNLVGMESDDGVFLYGGFGILVNRVAIVAPKRGYLVYYRGDDLLPHTCTTIATRCMLPVDRMKRIIDGLMAMRWLEQIPWPLEDASAAQAEAKQRQTAGRVFTPMSPLNDAIVGLTGKPFCDHDFATKKKVERYISEYSEDVVVEALRRALTMQGADRTLGRALARIGFEQAETLKRQPVRVDEKPPVEY